MKFTLRHLMSAMFCVAALLGWAGIVGLLSEGFWAERLPFLLAGWNGPPAPELKNPFDLIAVMFGGLARIVWEVGRWVVAPILIVVCCVKLANSGGGET